MLDDFGTLARIQERQRAMQQQARKVPLTMAEITGEGPIRAELLKARADLERMTLERDRALKAVRELGKQIADLRADLVAAKSGFSRTYRTAAVWQVQEAFIRELAVVGYQFKGKPFTLEDLLSRSRNERICAARHVAIYLCKRICHLSFPKIAAGFRRNDHTSAMHSNERAPEVMARELSLMTAANAVLAEFKEEL